MNVPQEARKLSDRLLGRCQSLVTDRGGATAIEYALIAGLISVIVIGGVTVLGTQISAEWVFLSNTVNPKLAQ